jgi:hypothetical protein
MPSDPPHLSFFPEEDPSAPWLHRAGSVLGAGAVAASLAAVPASLRIAHDASVPLLGAWLAVVACAMLPAIAFVAILRGARRGLQAFAGPDAPLVFVAGIAWCASTFAALAAFGAVLRATTHHHALAGVTFALGGLALGFAFFVLARRFVAIARAVSPRARYAWGGLVVGGASAALLMAALRLVSSGPAQPPLSPTASAVLVDLLAFAIAVGFLSRRAFARAAWLARAGIPLAVGLFVLGGAMLFQSSTVRTQLRERAPVFAPVAGLLGHD